MSLVQTDVGDLHIIDVLVARWNGTPKLKVHLYRNNYTPVESSLAANFTEANYEGYASQNVTGWTDATLVSNRGQTTADPNVFVHSAGSTSNEIYGYWIEDPADAGSVLWAEKFLSPITLAAAGDALALFLKYRNNTEP